VDILLRTTIGGAKSNIKTFLATSARAREWHKIFILYNNFNRLLSMIIIVYSNHASEVVVYIKSVTF
jgi:hypothetical protein